jgi:hypothetical protein
MQITRQYCKTIIITTHYIEEARQSDVVSHCVDIDDYGMKISYFIINLLIYTKKPILMAEKNIKFKKQIEGSFFFFLSFLLFSLRSFLLVFHYLRLVVKHLTFSLLL